MSAADLFGQQLRDARARRGLSVDQLAHETQIPAAHVEALESGRFEAVPGGLYRRAEVRAYAEAVGLDPEMTLLHLRVVTERPGAFTPAMVAATPVTGVEAPPVELEAALTTAGAAAHASAVSVSGPDPEPASTPEPESITVSHDAPSPVPRHASQPVRVTPPQVPPAVPPSTWPVLVARAREGAGDPRARWRLAAVLLLGGGALLWDASRVSQPAPAEAVTFTDIALPFDTSPVSIVSDVERIVDTAEPPRPRPRAILTAPPFVRQATRLDSGRLVVQSVPAGARVTVNGIGWGETPVSIRYLPFGTMRVRVVKDDHVAVDRVVELTPGAPTNTLRISLRSTQRTTRAPAMTDGPALQVTTVPAGARVTVNGIGWGKTPLAIPHLPPGVQRVRVVQDGYRSEERVVSVGDGQPRRVSIAMKPLS
jgi:hypothetical protein